ncbi:MAG: hypothetical protein M5U31_09750 [Acidimicrobiia bacterium]|nr:hypothetical protein [Acidimicrobiia bacterium]
MAREVRGAVGEATAEPRAAEPEVAAPQRGRLRACSRALRHRALPFTGAAPVRFLFFAGLGLVLLGTFSKPHDRTHRRRRCSV